MRAWPLGLLGMAGVGLGLFAAKPKDDWTVFVAGDFDGYLSPCGCTKPMSGGIRRMGTVVAQRSAQGPTTLLVSGSLVAGSSRQDEMKAETLAESFAAMGLGAMNYSLAEAKLGPGALLSLQRLSGDKLACLSMVAGRASEPFREVGPFLVAGTDAAPQRIARLAGESPAAIDAAMAAFLDQAAAAGKAPVLLLRGDRAQAEALARSHRALALIVYRSAGDPRRMPEKVGGTWLVSPGEFAKHLIRLRWADGRFQEYVPVALTEDVPDGPVVARIFDGYLARVDQEGLLDRLPRRAGAAYAGSAACRSCHAVAYRKWAASRHARALASLKKVREARDPDCVGCHVTGLASRAGYRSTTVTPGLAAVGCESCHGPAADHARQPRHKLPKADQSSCASCHSASHSPGFVFHRYWGKIAHR